MKSFCKFITNFLSGVLGFIVFLVQPLRIITLHKVSFFLWMSFTIFGGLIGVFISVVRYSFFGQYTIAQAICIESMNGSFYTYSIAVVASVLSGVFIIFAEKKDLNFRRYQIPFITISIFLMFFGGVFYALAKQTSALTVGCIPNASDIDIEWKQCSVFVMSIIFSIYSFCVCRLDDHQADFASFSDGHDKNKHPDIPEMHQGE